MDSTDPSTPTDPFADVLVYDGRLVVQWQPLTELPSSQRLTQLNESNEWFLRASAALREQPQELADDGDELAPEIARLDLKMNLLLELVGHTLSRQLGLPEPAAVRLSSRGLQWMAPAPVAVGELGLISLYLQPELPRAVQLGAEVVAGDGHQITAAFRGISQVTADWLDKYIFRHHRRAVAHHREGRR